MRKTKITELTKPHYYYDIFKKHQDNKDYLEYLNHNSLSKPIINEYGDTIGFTPVLDDEELIGERIDLDNEIYKTNEFKDFENNTMKYDETAEDKNLIQIFDEDKAVQWLYNHYYFKINKMHEEQEEQNNKINAVEAFADFHC